MNKAIIRLIFFLIFQKIDGVEEKISDTQDEIKKFKVQTKKDLNLYSERLSKVEGKTTKKVGKGRSRKIQISNDEEDSEINEQNK